MLRAGLRLPEPMRGNQMETIETVLLPQHIAIIMDGNGRWAKKRLMERFKGHERGADAVRETVTTCRELGIAALSLYAFSEENWARPKREVDALMHLLKRYLSEEREEIMGNNIRLVASGRLERLPDSVKNLLFPLMADSAQNTGMMLNLCLSYGGKEELTDACRAIARKVEAGELAPDDIDEATLTKHLYVADLPPVDLMIRTSGEQRSSGYLPWQITYAEFYFTDVLWPDFNKDVLHEAIREYQRRERRFGKTGDQIA
jgi:undecaprenyl diphosphate synthase